MDMLPPEIGNQIKRKAFEEGSVRIPGTGRVYKLQYNGTASLVLEKEGLTYDPTLPYEENFTKPLPAFQQRKLCKNTKLGSGIAINSRYVKSFSNLGYGWITYKTVRSYKKEAYPFPNIAAFYNGKWMHPDKLDWHETKNISAITNSFAMPSTPPNFWIEDVNKSKSCLRPDQKLVLSYVGDSLEDFTYTSSLVDKTNADFAEMDLSCPNYGELIYLNPELTCKIVDSTETSKPLILKVGAWKSYEEIKEFCEKVGNKIYGIEAINGIKEQGFSQILPGRNASGVCGPKILETAIQNIDRLYRAREELGLEFKIFGIGGVHDKESASRMFNCGADVVGSVTAAMLKPDLASRIQNAKEI